MAINSHHNLSLQLPKHQAFFMIIITILSILMSFPFTAQSAAAMDNITFTFNKFSPNMADIKFEGDASASDPTGIIQLTKDLQDLSSGGSVGRATYAKPMHLWDNATGRLADFSTRFSFAINSQGNNTKGSGFAFFLGENGSQIPPNSGEGYLGLSNPTGQHKFVAVEFDTAWTSDWDPSSKQDHIGIDLNSMRSTITIPWSLNNIINGGRVEVWIDYNSSTKNLTVFVSNGDSASYTRKDWYNLFAVRDLREYLPEWVTIGFSAATTIKLFQKHEIYYWDFSSSLQLDHENEINSTSWQAAGPTSPKKRTSKHWLLPVSVTIGVVLLLLGLVGSSLWMKARRRRREGNPMNMDDELARVTVPKKFSYAKLAAATDNFSEAKLLGKGGSGRVFSGILSSDNNRRVAVKKITSEGEQASREYASEVKAINRMRHRNLVKLIGWCHQKKELLIVYEFLENKSLDFHLFSQTHLLTWDKRYDIALGLASALFYMQEGCDKCVLHRDIKSSNILLDSECKGKLGDFGIARLVDHGQISGTTDLIGTDGYMAPEYSDSGKATKETDIFSFGIVALEIACGKPALSEVVINGTRRKIKLVETVWIQYGRGNVLGAADARLGQNYVEEQMRRLILAGLACAHPNASDRPTIKQVIDILQNPTHPLPELPLVMPVPSSVAAHQAVAFSSLVVDERTSRSGQATPLLKFSSNCSNNPPYTSYVTAPSGAN